LEKQSKNLKIFLAKRGRGEKRPYYVDPVSLDMVLSK
jgi:hypothetical protein